MFNGPGVLASSKEGQCFFAGNRLWRPAGGSGPAVLAHSVVGRSGTSAVTSAPGRILGERARMAAAIDGASTNLKPSRCIAPSGNGTSSNDLSTRRRPSAGRSEPRHTHRKSTPRSATDAGSGAGRFLGGSQEGPSSTAQVVGAFSLMPCDVGNVDAAQQGGAGGDGLASRP